MYGNEKLSRKRSMIFLKFFFFLDIRGCLGFRGEKDDSLSYFLQDIISTVLNSKTSPHLSE